MGGHDNLENRIRRTIFDALGDPRSMEPPERVAMLKLGIDFLRVKHKIDEGRDTGAELDKMLETLDAPTDPPA